MRLGPSNQAHTDCGLVFRWGDGPRPPSLSAGLPCQATSFDAKVAIPWSIATLTILCRAFGTVNTKCLNVQFSSGHRPRRPKLVQSPLSPTVRFQYLTLLRCANVMMSISGYSRVYSFTVDVQMVSREGNLCGA